MFTFVITQFILKFSDIGLQQDETPVSNNIGILSGYTKVAYNTCVYKTAICS